jgi:hypothetical protein
VRGMGRLGDWETGRINYSPSTIHHSPSTI